MTITQTQYDKMVYGMRVLEHDALSGKRGQLFFDKKSGEIWLGQLAEGERYPDDENYVVIYAVEPWEDKLKDLYEDENSDVNWGDKKYKFTDEYAEFEYWYFDDCNDGFKVFEILDEALERNGIEVKSC